MRKAVYTALMALAFLLAACGGQTGTGGGGNTVTVRLTDPQNAFQKAYYRVENGSWTQLIFANDQATFQASNTYEVAARCETEVQFYKATRDKLSVLPILCPQKDRSNPDSDSVFITIDVSLPPKIGNISIRDGDTVAMIGASQPSQNLRATLSLYHPRGQQTVGLMVFRGDFTDYDIIPIGGKLIDLDIQERQVYLVDSAGWVPFAHRTISVTPPSGYGLGFTRPTVAFYKKGMKRPLPVGLGGLYGVFPPEMGGRYVGYAVYENTSLGRFLFAMKDTGGSDWNISLPSPWVTGQFNVNGSTFTVTYPNAQAFSLAGEGFLRDRRSDAPLLVKATFLSEGSSTTYALPDLSDRLGYHMDSNSTRNLQVVAVARDLNAYMNIYNLFFASEGPSTEDTSIEDLFRGVDMALAIASASYTGDSYTLP